MNYKSLLKGNEKEGKYGVGKAVGLAAWSFMGEKLILPSALRICELLTGNKEAVVASDFLLAALAYQTCPLQLLKGAMVGTDVVAMAAGLAVAIWAGRTSVLARRKALKSTKKQSFRVEGENGYVWRSSLAPGGRLVGTVYPNVNTLYHNFFLLAARNYPVEPCLGVRAGSGYTFETYRETARKASNFGSGLVALGLPAGCRVGIYSVNCPQWVLAELACYAYGFINVALYSTLGQPAVIYVVGHSEMAVSVCSIDTLESLLDAIPECPTLRTIIFMDEKNAVPPLNLVNKAKAYGVRLLSFSEVMNLGASNPTEHHPPKPSDLATIMYTSGTTGNPKGVMLTHANVIANTTTCPILLEGIGEDLGLGDRYLSYLPLAHIFERSMMATMFMRGVGVGFFGGRSEALVDDIAALRPTILVGVPRVFNRVHQKVVQKVEEGSKVAKFLFNRAMKETLKVRRAGGAKGSLPLWDALVFRKIKDRLGGRCRIVVSGGAPLGSDVQEFLTAAVGCCIQGYGLTETSAAGTIALLNDINPSHVGPPSPSVDIKLDPVPEMDYHPTDKPLPRGEVCIRGYAVMQGYYKAPEMTAEVMDAGGWFHTGDIGQMNSAGTLSIVDRKKNIFKLAQGEYVAAEKLEVLYQGAKFVSQIFVYGDSFQSVLVAVVVPDEDALRRWASEREHISPFNDTAVTFAEICAMPEARKAVLAELVKQGKQSAMKGFEIVKAVALEHEAFSVENDLLTPTFKLRRPQLKARYLNVISDLYRNWCQ